MLIVPNSNLRCANKEYAKMTSPVFPIGVAYLASTLEKADIEVSIEDQVATGDSTEMLLKKIKTYHPQVIGISCLTATLSAIAKLVKSIKDYFPGIKIIQGNIHATMFSEGILKSNLADVVVRGEGEETILEVVEALKDNRNFKNIKGISFKINGEIINNTSRDLIADLDKLPYPAWHLLDLNLYLRQPMLGSYNRVLMPILGSRGCPYHCIFCSQDKMYDRPRYRKTAQIINEIEHNMCKYNVNGFVFMDAFFPFSVKHGLEFCQALQKRKLDKKIRWMAENRVDKVSYDLLVEMGKTGCELMMYGFEVGNQQVLDSLNKKTTILQAKEAMRATKKAGINTLGLFVLGVPGETKETCIETIKFAKELDCDIVKFNIATPLPGSKFFEDSIKNNPKVLGLTDRFHAWADWADSSGEIIYAPERMTRQELIFLQRMAMFTYYCRFKIIIRCLLKRIFSFSDFLFGGWFLVKSYISGFFIKYRKRNHV